MEPEEARKTLQDELDEVRTDLIRLGAREKALDVAAEQRKQDGLFGTLDARGC